MLRRKVGKAVGLILYECRPLQASAGLKAGADGTIHAMKKIYLQESIEDIILVDLSNAYNSIHQKRAVHNIHYICLPLETVLMNTYRNPSRLFITGGNEILSKEDITQGDNLTISFYGLGTKLLLDKLSEQVIQFKNVWLAVNEFGARTLNKLQDLWDIIISEGQKIGYYVNESKSWLILKDSSQPETSKQIFRIAISNLHVREKDQRLG